MYFDHYLRTVRCGGASNLNAGWDRITTVEGLIEECLLEPEGGIIGTDKGRELRALYELPSA